jgi:hypothetical protein
MSAPQPPKDNLLKHLFVAFAIALVGYVAFFAFDSHMRLRHGPWVVDFQVTTNQEPLLVINEPQLGIKNVRIILEGETVTNAPGVFSFDSPTKRNIPYGRVRFHDLTYLPGTITLDLYGHEIELIPRALFLNTRETPWQSEATYRLTVTNKIPGLKDRDRKGRR